MDDLDVVDPLRRARQSIGLDAQVAEEPHVRSGPAPTNRVQVGVGAHHEVIEHPRTAPDLAADVAHHAELVEQ